MQRGAFPLRVSVAELRAAHSHGQLGGHQGEEEEEEEECSWTSRAESSNDVGKEQLFSLTSGVRLRHM